MSAESGEVTLAIAEGWVTEIAGTLPAEELRVIEILNGRTDAETVVWLRWLMDHDEAGRVYKARDVVFRDELVVAARSLKRHPGESRDHYVSRVNSDRLAADVLAARLRLGLVSD